MSTLTLETIKEMFPNTGIYDVKFWDGNNGDVLLEGLWLIIIDKNGKRWPVRSFSNETNKWVHNYDKELKHVGRPFFKGILEGEENQNIQGFLYVITFMSVLYVHSATPINPDEEGLTLDYESYKF